MSEQILSTKLHMPALRLGLVPRSRLIDQLTTGFHGKLTLISAPAGFGKTTLVTQLINRNEYPIAWLSLDESDNDPVRFLTYVVAAIQSMDPEVGTSVLPLLLSPQPPRINSLLTPLLNDIMTVQRKFMLVFDDYHILDSQEIDSALTFLIDNQPPQMHLVIMTREDPHLPLARMRASGQLTELRAADLRFTVEEATEFLNRTMGLSLSQKDVIALEARTEGWIAGLQLAALSVQGRNDTADFIASFTGSHHFVLDYLIEEVLNHQPTHIQDFLLKTSILERMCGSLCDAILSDGNHAAADLLESIRQANLFVVPLDNQRRWYRYHHLFGDLLHKRLRQFNSDDINTLHIRASNWYETNGFEVEAFQHAAASNDLERAERLINGTSVPLYFRGIVLPILEWLDTLSPAELDARPSLWITYAWSLMAAHRSTQIEQKLQAAELALQGVEMDDHTRDLMGHIAAIRAMEAAIQYDTNAIIAHALQALDLLRPDNLYIRTAVTRSLAIAYQFRGDRAKAEETYEEAIAMSKASDNYFVNVLATTGLGIVQETETRLYDASSSYQRVFDLVNDPNQPISCAAYLGMARIHYEWNDLDAAQEYGQRGVRLAQQIESIDSAAGGEIFLARLTLAQGDIAVATTLLDAVEKVIRQQNYVMQIPTAASLRVLLCLRQGEVQQAAHVAHSHDLPLSQARVYLAEGKSDEALTVLRPYRQKMEAKRWQDEVLKILVLEALAIAQSNQINEAVAVIGEALALASPGGHIRTFLDEGQPMQKLLSETADRGIVQDYIRVLLDAFNTDLALANPTSTQPLIEPLSDRELEILRLVADGLSNREISDRLFISLSTVKGHNRNIFDKLHVRRRTEAVARARELGLI